MTLTVNLFQDYIKLLLGHLHLAQIHVDVLVTSTYTRYHLSQVLETLFSDFDPGLLLDLFGCDSCKVPIFVQHSCGCFVHIVLKGNSELLHEHHFFVN